MSDFDGEVASPITFIPGDYELAKQQRFRVIVERDEYSILLRKTSEGRYELTPETRSVADLSKTRTILTVEVNSIDLARLLEFLTGGYKQAAKVSGRA